MPSAACIAYSLVLAPGFADRGTYAAHSRRRSSAAPAADGAAQAGGPGRRAVLRLSPAATPARAILRKHGFAVPRIAAMDWTALSVSLWLGAGTIAILLPFGIWFGRLLAVRDFRGKLLRRGARHRAARAAADGARVLSARHVRRAFAARPGVSGRRRAVAAVLVRGTAARVGHRQHSVRRPADSARLRGDSRATSATRPRAAASRRGSASCASSCRWPGRAF